MPRLSCKWVRSSARICDCIVGPASSSRSNSAPPPTGEPEVAQSDLVRAARARCAKRSSARERCFTAARARVRGANPGAGRGGSPPGGTQESCRTAEACMPFATLGSSGVDMTAVPETRHIPAGGLTLSRCSQAAAPLTPLNAALSGPPPPRSQPCLCLRAAEREAEPATDAEPAADDG